MECRTAQPSPSCEPYNTHAVGHTFVVLCSDIEYLPAPGAQSMNTALSKMLTNMHLPGHFVGLTVFHVHGKRPVHTNVRG